MKIYAGQTIDIILDPKTTTSFDTIEMVFTDPIWQDVGTWTPTLVNGKYKLSNYVVPAASTTRVYLHGTIGVNHYYGEAATLTSHTIGT